MTTEAMPYLPSELYSILAAYTTVLVGSGCHDNGLYNFAFACLHKCSQLVTGCMAAVIKKPELLL